MTNSYDVELPPGCKLITGWEYLNPIFDPVLTELFDTGDAWFRAITKPLNSWANIKIVVLQFKTSEAAAIFKLTYL